MHILLMLIIKTRVYAFDWKKIPLSQLSTTQVLHITALYLALTFEVEGGILIHHIMQHRRHGWIYSKKVFF